MDKVILGMPGNWASSYYEAADIYTTKIGGLPDWPFSIASEKSDLLDCITCGNKLSLLAQVYAPLSNQSFETERCVYVLCCLVPNCQSLSWRAFRVQKISSNEAVHDLTPSPYTSNNICKDDDWQVGIGEEGDPKEDGGDIDLEQLMMQFSEVASISSTGKRQNKDGESSRKCRPTGQPIRPVVDKTPVMPCFYIYPEEEKLSTSKSSKSVVPSFQEHEKNSEDCSDGETYEEEKYEYDRALNADRTYLKFKKRMDECSDQCLRYSHGGKPLLASAEVGDPAMCRLCGGARQYEMQLMPPVIYFLQKESDEKQRTMLEKLDWMTLLVYTCSKSCTDSSLNFGSDGWMVAEETVIPQYELLINGL